MEDARFYVHAGEFLKAGRSAGVPPALFARRSQEAGETSALRSPATLLAKRLRGDAGLLAEKAGKMRRVREGEIVSDFVDRLIGEEELAFRLGQNALADEVACGDPGSTLDVIVEAIRRHGELAGVEGKLALLAEMLLDQVAQRIDRRVRRNQRRRAASGATRREPRHRNRDERQIAAHGEAVARTGEKPLLVEIGAKPADPLYLVLARQRHHRIGGERAQRRDRLA